MWILIITLVTGDGVTLTTQEYTSAARCVSAGKAWKKKAVKMPSVSGVSVICTEK